MQDGEAVIGVWTRNLSEGDQERIADELATSARTEQVGDRKIIVRSAAITPFGAATTDKQGDTVLTNMISRIAAIKEREHQAHDQRPFVLWIDLQNDAALMFDLFFHLHPLSSLNGAVESGGYWHALYGRKGDILLESARRRAAFRVTQSCDGVMVKLRWCRTQAPLVGPNMSA